jgi:acyl carrier protein
MATVSTKYLTPMRVLLDRDIRAIVAAKTQVDVTGISDEVALGDLGLDSLALSDLAETIEEKFDVHIPNRMLPATLTVGQLITLICENHGAYNDSRENILVPEPAD